MGRRSTESGPQRLSVTIEGALSVGGEDPVPVQVGLERDSDFMRITFTEPRTGREWFSVLLATSSLTFLLGLHGLCSPIQQSGKSS